MTTAHTPGPWIVGPHPGNSAGEDWRMILSVTSETGPLYIGEAIEPDARLIAAAPDMLAALAIAEAFMSGFEDDEMQEGMAEKMAQIRAAIAKAGG